MVEYSQCTFLAIALARSEKPLSAIIPNVSRPPDKEMNQGNLWHEHICTATTHVEWKDIHQRHWHFWFVLWYKTSPGNLQVLGERDLLASKIIIQARWRKTLWVSMLPEVSVRPGEYTVHSRGGCHLDKSRSVYIPRLSYHGLSFRSQNESMYICEKRKAVTH